MSKISQKIIKIQALWRRALAVRNLERNLDQARATLNFKREFETPEEQALKDFAQQLTNKKITPEGFFRICDPDYKMSVRVDSFKEQLNRLGIKLSKGQQSRLIMILDEDLEGTITREEFYNALEAYNCSGEKHKAIGEGAIYHPYEHKVLFKLIDELRRKNISNLEMFSACDVSDD